MGKHASQRPPSPVVAAALDKRARDRNPLVRESGPGGRRRPTRSKPQQLAWRQRIADLVRVHLSPRARMELAFALDVHPSRVEAWSVAAFADAQTLPAFALVLMNRDARDAILAAIAAMGDALDRGDL